MRMGNTIKLNILNTQLGVLQTNAFRVHGIWKNIAVTGRHL